MLQPHHARGHDFDPPALGLLRGTRSQACDGLAQFSNSLELMACFSVRHELAAARSCLDTKPQPSLFSFTLLVAPTTIRLNPSAIAPSRAQCLSSLSQSDRGASRVGAQVQRARC